MGLTHHDLGDFGIGLHQRLLEELLAEWLATVSGRASKVGYSRPGGTWVEHRWPWSNLTEVLLMSCSHKLLSERFEM